MKTAIYVEARDPNLTIIAHNIVMQQLACRHYLIFKEGETIEWRYFCSMYMQVEKGKSG